MAFVQIFPSHSYISFKCMFYAVTSVQFPPYNLKLNEKNRDFTVEVSHLVMCDTVIDCHVYVGTVVFTLVSGRSYTVQWLLLRWTSLKDLEHKIECILYIFCKIEDFRKNTVSLILQLSSCLKLGISTPPPHAHKLDFIWGLCAGLELNLCLLLFQKDFLIKIQNESLL